MRLRIMAAWAAVAAVVVVGGSLAGCGGSSGTDGTDGEQGPEGPPGPPAPIPDPDPTDPNLSESADLPGVVLTVSSLSGASGPNGAFQVGDRIALTFTLTKGDGSYLGLSEMDSGSVYVSGPTTHYQRVLPRATDLRAAAVDNGNGSYTYTFAAPIPPVYAAPYNDTASFGAGDGELAGQALESGTYTLGIETYKNYFVGDETFRDPVNVTKDFLFGTATVVEPRQVVARENCNQCHVSLQAHGGFRRDTKLCVLCHTAGAEDRNTAAVEGGTPGVSIEFQSMIHRIHNGEHLPSVLGVGTNPDGSPNYGVTPKPLQIMGNGDRIHDFSEVGFPVWPNLNIAMPRDTGYTALTAAQKVQDDTIRTGVTDCNVCHGDPDGAGPLTTPAQGGNSLTKPTRRACGSCHDDVNWTLPYTANTMTMPAQSGDAACAICHPASGTILSPVEGHRHPLKNPALNPGVNFAISSVYEAGANNANGRIDPGEKVQAVFTLKDDAGADVAGNTLASMAVVLSGPTTNYNVVLDTSLPPAVLGAGPGYTVNLPEPVFLEKVGTSTASGTETFTASRTPFWNVTGAATTVLVRTGTSGGSTTLSAEAPAIQNWIDVADAANFARGDFVVVDDGMPAEEYQKVQFVDGRRLWFSTLHSPASQPYLRFPHTVNATVKEVQLTTKTVTTDYTVNAAAGQVSEVTEFGAGSAVLVSYTSDFVMPSLHPGAINNVPDVDETWGKWAGKSIAPGTYTVTLWGRRANFSVPVSGESTSYGPTSPGGTKNFLVGSAATLEPYAAISSGNNCLRCHQDLYFHGGGRRGFDTCISCHGGAGGADRPRYVAANAPDTPGTTINYRTMIHKIHRGKDLPDADTYTVVGFGSGAYPNNFGLSSFREIGFPAMPSGVKDCSVCHGAGNDHWKSPPDRNHPTQQGLAVRTWRAACGSCHSSTPATAHIDANTAPATGAEACAVCHGQDREWPVERKHKIR